MNQFLKVAFATLILLLLPKICSAEEPVKVSVCKVLDNPAAYNHKLIEVSGDVSRGFEGFTLTDKGCKKQSFGIWLEIGGRVGSQVVYCCGVTADPKRKEPLVVEGIETTILQDRAFDTFQSLTLRKGDYGSARVTIIGRYFSGEKQTLPGGTFWMGYGHMGMFSLLVIQQIVTAQAE